MKLIAAEALCWIGLGERPNTRDLRYQEGGFVWRNGIYIEN